MKERAKMLPVLNRIVLLVAVLAAGLAAMWWARTRPAADPPRLSYIATAHQLGVVGYRDPVGAISVDGKRFAYAEGRRLFEVAVGGGAVVEIAAAEGQIRHIAPRGSTGEWIFEDGDASQRWWVASASAPKRPLFRANAQVEGNADSTHAKLGLDELRQLSSSPDGQLFVGTSNKPSGAELWRVTADGTRAELTRVSQPLAWPVWTPAGDLACTMLVNGHWRLSRPCGEPPIAFEPAIDVIGPVAFLYGKPMAVFAAPNDHGTVDLWRATLDSRKASRIVTFERDSYAPSIAADDTIVFKTQSYRTSVVELDLASGKAQQLSTLQSETPSYHPDGRKIAVTYGTWRRVLDDAKYPDIAQEIGVLSAAEAGGALLTQPTEVIAASNSEDQAMAWSPNGKWIAFHSHREQSDDVWLRPAAGGGTDRRISFLGRGAEVGWPRWSPDGRFVLFDGASPTTKRSVPFVVGIDQESGEVTVPPREIPVAGFEGEITHAEWLPDNRTIVAIAKDAPGQHVVLTLPLTGGQPAIVHRFASEHDFPGLASAPDGRSVAMLAPAADGFYQIFRLPLDGGPPQQLTTDRSNKSQPAFSPDGRRLAYTVWSYDAHFFSVDVR